jgi:hypothetical protein
MRRSSTLLAVAAKLGKRSFSPPEYDRCVERWLIEEERAGRGRNAALQRIPNSEQIIHYCESWAEATRRAGLDPPSGEAGRRRGCPVPDAIAYHFAERGVLPTRKDLFKFAEEMDFALAASRGRWHGWIILGVERIKEIPQLPTPPPYGSRPPSNSGSSGSTSARPCRSTF